MTKLLLVACYITNVFWTSRTLLQYITASCRSQAGLQQHRPAADAFCCQNMQMHHRQWQRTSTTKGTKASPSGHSVCMPDVTGNIVQLSAACSSLRTCSGGQGPPLQLLTSAHKLTMSKWIVTAAVCPGITELPLQTAQKGNGRLLVSLGTIKALPDLRPPEWVL